MDGNPIDSMVPALFEPSDIIEVRRIRRHGGDDDPRSTWHVAAKVGLMYDRLLDDNADGWDVYFGGNPRPALGKRGDKCITGARTVFVDFDDTSLDVARERIANVRLPIPTLIVLSGHGVHAYWRLTVPLTDMAVWTRTQQRLIFALGSDPRIFNPERLMRLAGFLNLNGEPFCPCDIAAINRSLTYPHDALTAILDTAGVPADPFPKPVRKATPEQLAARKSRGGVSVIDQFNQTYDIAAVLSSHGYTDARHGRMNRPGGATAGVHIIGGLSFHFSSNDPLNDGKFGYFSYHNPFSAFSLLAHGGDVSRAVREAARLMGLDAEPEHTARWHERRRQIREMAQRVSDASGTEAA